MGAEAAGIPGGVDAAGGAHPAGIARATDARIVGVEAIPLRAPLERTATGATLNLTERCAILTRVHTDAGVTGECYLGGDDVLQPAIVALIGDELEPLVTGRRVVAIEEVWAATRAATRPFLRDRRIALRAQACVDAALHDAVGRVAGLPTAALWGGAKESVPVFALGGYYVDGDPLTAIRSEIDELVALGIGGLKIKVGRDPAADAARITAAREHAGEGFLIAADANQAWSRSEALDFAERVRGVGLAWLEEPCHWENDRTDLAAVRTRTGLPVAAGQSEIARAGCRDLMAAGAVDVCNFDAYWGGGPTEWRKVAHIAEGFGITPLQHLEPQIGIPMVAGVAAGHYAEVMPPWRDPFFYRLDASTGDRPFRDGRRELSSRPGWGIQIDEDYLAHVRQDTA